MQGILPSVAYNPAMLGILSPKQAGPSAGGKNPTAATGPMAQERPRVSGWRVLDRVLGGQTISGGLDAERERLTTEAARPQAMQRQQQLRVLADRMGPAAMIAFETNPEAFGESLGMGFRPVTASAGSAIHTPATGQTFGVSSFDTSGDQTLERDPVTGQVRPVYTRTTPSISERTDQQKADTAELAARFANVASNANVVDLRNNGATVAEGYRPPNVVAVQPGGEAVIVQDGQEAGRVSSTQARPMSDADQSAVQRADLTVTQSNSAISRARRLSDMITNGQLRLGMVERAGADLEVAAGRASPNALAIKDLEQWAKQARDAILAANTGVQTDQDAVRALDNVLANMNDARLVQQYLGQFIDATTSTRQVFERDIARRSNQSAPANPGAAQGGPVTVNTPAEAAALAPGTRYRTPQGQEFVR